MLEHVDQRQVFSDLLTLRDWWITAGESDPQPVWKAMRRAAHQIRGRLPSDPDKADASPAVMERLRELVEEVFALFSFDLTEAEAYPEGREGLRLLPPDRRQYAAIRSLIADLAPDPPPSRQRAEVCPRCHSVQLTESAERLKIHTEAEICGPGESSADEAPANPPKVHVQDGPCGGDSFTWRGRTERGLKSLPWRLVAALWVAHGRTEAIEDLAESVWGDRNEEITEAQVSSARRESNKFFERRHLPFRVAVKQRGRYVRLEAIGEQESSPEAR